MFERSKIKRTDGFVSFYAFSCVVLCCVRQDSQKADSELKST
jgi:hypothetical protein